MHDLQDVVRTGGTTVQFGDDALSVLAKQNIETFTTIDGSPFELTVYKSGDKYVASRSNEFGYANYEVQAVIQ